MSHQGIEEDEWIPLEPRTEVASDMKKQNRPHADLSPARSWREILLSRRSMMSTSSTTSTHGSGTSSSNKASDTGDNDADANADADAKSGSNPADMKLAEIRNRHETNQTMKRKLVHHPLSIFPFRFLYHLVREVWACHYFVRWGVLFIVCGALLQSASFVFLFYVSLRALPRIILMTTISGAITYLYFQGISTSMQNIQSYIRIPDGVQDAFFSCLENVNGGLLQNVLIVVVYITPLGMEMMALHFLARVNDTSTVSSFISLVSVTVELAILIPFHFEVKRDTSAIATNTSKVEELSPLECQHHRGIYKFGPLSFIKKPKSSLFDCRVHAWIYLYATALFLASIMVRMNQFHKPMLLGGPFLLASGAFLILSIPRGEDEDGQNLIMDVLRRVIRQTLADVMVEVGENVAQDEMLRLAMLRWIVDYWAFTSTKDEGSSKPEQRKEEDQPTSTTSRATTSSPVPTPTVSTATISANAGSVHSNTKRDYQREEEMGWSELSSMLSLTIDQMHNEVPSSDPSKKSSPEEKPANNSDASNHRKNESMQQLQNMMKSLNVDERAKPAVKSYKLAIESIPPPRHVAIAVAIARRCPALLSSSLLLFLQPSRSIQSIMLLLPLILLEVMRVKEWLTACHQTEELLLIRSNENAKTKGDIDNNFLSKLLPVTMDPMHILLSEDCYSTYNRGTALQVWFNVNSSIQALGSGLVAMECAHVASNLAFDVISLAQFADEVRNEGIKHGLGLLLTDMYHFHLEASKKAPGGSTQSETPSKSKYSAAAVSIVENSKNLSQSVSNLVQGDSEEKGLFSFVAGLFYNKGEPMNKADDEKNPKSSENASGSRDESDENEKDNTVKEDKEVGAKVDAIPCSTIKNDLEIDDDGPSTPHATVGCNVPDATINNVISDDESWTDIDNVPSKCHDEKESLQGSDQPMNPRTTNLDETVNAAVSFTLGKTQEKDCDNIDNIDSKSEKCSTRQQEIKEPQSDGLKWLGAGAAIIGTVIGGITLVGNKEDKAGSENKDGHQQESKVVIERLDESE